MEPDSSSPSRSQGSGLWTASRLHHSGYGEVQEEQSAAKRLEPRPHINNDVNEDPPRFSSHGPKKILRPTSAPPTFELHGTPHTPQRSL